ncbi:MAG: phenylalanine--tRNA ligase subunit alpha [Thermodesulfobacteriota bacterium]
MNKRLSEIRDEALLSIKEAASLDDANSLKVKYLGRKGEISSLLKGLGSLDPSERREAGQEINNVKAAIEESIDSRISALQSSLAKEKLGTESIDITLPGRKPYAAKLHPVTTIMNEVEDIFTGLGFSIAEGPELELDYYNFEALNIPRDHPARDMQDTFYISNDLLLRTHTSPVQVRVMEAGAPPLRVIAPGTVYRRDSDVTHTPMFHQVEGFMVGSSVTFSNLKAVLTHFLETLFGKGVSVRFRPSFFPFTEPSAEVDIQCVICGGSGPSCRVCKGTGWLEILGAGMIHPNVFKAVGYDADEVSGFAFGLGIERIAMLKFGIDDIRLFFENDLRFITQF